MTTLAAQYVLEKQLFEVKRRNQSRIIEFINLLRQHPQLAKHLDETLKTPFVHFKHRISNRQDEQLAKDIKPPYLFELIAEVGNDLADDADERLGARRVIESLLTPDIAELKDSKGLTPAQHLAQWPTTNASRRNQTLPEDDFIQGVRAVLAEYAQLNPHKNHTGKRAPILAAQLEKVITARDEKTRTIEMLELKQLVKRFSGSKTYGHAHFLGKHTGGLDTLLR